ncbi:MAG: hypothetical protein RL088_1758 [Verrucomicrobiota bacterium]
MKSRLVLAAAISTLLAACGDEKRAAELEALKAQNAELAARMAAKERADTEEKLRAAQTEAERAADANRAEAGRLAEERAAIDAERKRIDSEAARISAAQRAAMEEELRKRDDALRIAEKKAADATRAKAEAEQARIAAEREAKRQREESERQQPRGRNMEFFYTSLEPYGDWDEVEGYGPVFQPREAQRDRNWRPYTDGEWVWTEQGWTWRSNEPHGWATAHYGRWVRHAREGWMWVPGTEWAPAWVSWRKSESHIGWAPLPPEAHSDRGFNATVDEYYDIGVRNYVFVPRERFGGAKTYVGHAIAPERNITIIQNTINVTNITYRGTGNSAVIVNNGPELDFANSRSAIPVPIVRLERSEVQDARSVSGPAVIAGGMLRLIAPVFAHERAATPPRLIRKTATREIDRGWAGDDAAAQKMAREKAAAEARKAEQEEREAFAKLVKDAKPLPLPATPATKTPASAPVLPRPLPPLVTKPATEPKPVVKVPEPKRPAVPAEPAPAKVVKEQKPAAPEKEKAIAVPNFPVPPERPAKPAKPEAPVNADRPAALAVPPAPVKSPLPEEAAPSAFPEKKPVTPVAPSPKTTKKPSIVAPLKPVLAKPDGEIPKLQLPPDENPTTPKAEFPPAPKPETPPKAAEIKKDATPAIEKRTDEKDAEKKKAAEKADDLKLLKKQLKPAGEILKRKAE